MKKFFTLSFFFASSLLTMAKEEKAPKAFKDYFTPDLAVKGAVVVMVPPDEIQEYVKKVQLAREKDPEWFREYSGKATAGVPLPFHEKLGLTKKEYQDYISLWDARALKPIENGEVIVRLEKTRDDLWMIRVTGLGQDITTMRYSAKNDTFKTTSGKLERIGDINANEQSILGAWTGKEWKMQTDDGFGLIKENFAVGRLKKEDYGLLVYRLQEVSSTGRRLYDRSMVIRFELNPE